MTDVARVVSIDSARAPRMRLAIARLLWLAVADAEGCGCEATPTWTAPLCEAVRCLGIGDHFDARQVEDALHRRGLKP